MAHTLIQIQSYLFISQLKVSFQFLIFKESSYMVFTSTYHIFIQSHILRLQVESATFKSTSPQHLEIGVSWNKKNLPSVIDINRKTEKESELGWRLLSMLMKCMINWSHCSQYG